MISTLENRKKTALQYIKELKLLGTKRDSDGNQKSLSESCFKQIMYDRGFGRGFHCWKLELIEEHRDLRTAFARAYLTWDWINNAVSIDEAKVVRAEYDRRVIWRCPGEEMSGDLIGKINQEDDKAMCMISGKIAHSKSTINEKNERTAGKINGKGKLIFLWDETEDEKSQAKEALLVENYGKQGLQALAFAVEMHDTENKENETGRKKPGSKPQFENYLKQA